MELVIAASRRNVEERTGGPFAAAIFEIASARLVALGTNLVVTQGMSMLHAEIVAIALAQTELGTYDLARASTPGYELVASTEPCSMCLGAIPWSGIRRLVTGARAEDARNIGFDEGARVANWVDALEYRRIEVTVDVRRDAAREVLALYARTGGCIYSPGR